MQFFKYKYFVLLILFNTIFSETVNNNFSVIKKVEEHFLSNFDWECEAIHAGASGSFKYFIENCLKQQKNMKAISKAKVVFDILKKEEKNNHESNKNESKIIDLVTWDDVNLFRNIRNKKAINIAQKVDRTYTYLGKATIYAMLAQPTVDIALLQKRQSIIKTILDDSNLYNFLDNAFNDLKNYENLFFSFYANDIFKTLAENQYTNDPEVNKNQIKLNIKNFIDHQKRIIVLLTKLSAATILPIYGVTKILGSKQTSKLEVLLSGMGFISGLNCMLGIKSDCQTIFDNFIMLQCLQEKLNHVGSYLDLMSKINKKLVEYTEIYNELSVHEIKDLFENCEIQNQELNLLITSLQSDTLTGKFSVFSNSGKILAAFQLMHQLKDNFNKALCALGRIEAYTSLARLYKEYENQKIKYSFANYVETEYPTIILKDFWNPIINESDVVVNSIAFDSGENCRNAIITGLNEGGKSTVIKSIAVNLILAQTLGITPAGSMTLTPFNKIGTYINITDDLHKRNSTFKSEVNRISNLLNQVNSLNMNEFWFMALDEPFKGTASLVAQAILYSFANNMSLSKNNICMIATHFPMLGKLESENKNFCNYRVIASNEDDNIQCLHILEKGLSRQNFALNILRSTGFSKQIINQALDIINKEKEEN